jgi:hypothetical protein
MDPLLLQMEKTKEKTILCVVYDNAQWRRLTISSPRNRKKRENAAYATSTFLLFIFQKVSRALSGHERIARTSI